jgi:HSP20 family protein
MNYGQQAQQAHYGNTAWNCGGGGHYRAQKFWQKMAAWQGRQGGGGFSTSYVPVNVQETETQYDLHIVAPGREKNNFGLSLKDRILTVSYKTPETATNGTWSKQEYIAADFERTFLLNNKIDETAIEARYTEGVLVVTLPKTAEAKQPPRDIELI